MTKSIREEINNALDSLTEDTGVVWNVDDSDDWFKSFKAEIEEIKKSVNSLKEQ